MPGRIVICGMGVIGKALATSLSQDHDVIALSARDIVSGGRDWIMTALRSLGDEDTVTVIFAHGTPVTTLRRKAEFDAALESRIVPLDLMLDVLEERAYAPVRPVLISSTVAGLGGKNIQDVPPWIRSGGLIEMQMRYEAAFLRKTVGFRCPLAVRVPTVIGPGGQFEHGLKRMQGTVLLSRIRMSGELMLPTTSLTRLSRNISDLIENDGTGVVDTSRRWRSYNEAVDAHCTTRPRIMLSRDLFARVLSVLGVRPEFLYLARPDELASQRKAD